MYFPCLGQGWFYETPWSGGVALCVNKTAILFPLNLPQLSAHICHTVRSSHHPTKGGYICANLQVLSRE